MSYGFDPYLSSWSPYHGAVYAVLSSVAKIVAAGGDYRQDPFHLPGVFPQDDRGSHPLEPALLQHFWAHTMHRWALALPSIGGKDSMSGTFNRRMDEVNVPPTLVSFAVDVASDKTCDFSGV